MSAAIGGMQLPQSKNPLGQVLSLPLIGMSRYSPRVCHCGVIVDNYPIGSPKLMSCSSCNPAEDL